MKFTQEQKNRINNELNYSGPKITIPINIDCPIDIWKDKFDNVFSSAIVEENQTSKIIRKKNDKLHCVRFPAIEYPDGRAEWWFEGNLVCKCHLHESLADQPIDNWKLNSGIKGANLLQVINALESAQERNITGPILNLNILKSMRSSNVDTDPPAFKKSIK